MDRLACGYWSFLRLSARLSNGRCCEAYRVEVSRDGLRRVVTVVQPRWTYTAADRAADGSGPVTISVVQLGTHGASRAAALAIV